MFTLESDAISSDGVRAYCQSLNHLTLSRFNESNKSKELSLLAKAKDFGTIVFDAKNRSTPQDKAHIIVLHGLGSEKSNIVSTLHYLSIFNQRGQGKKKSGKPPSIRRIIHDHFNFNVSAESVALPGTPGGINISNIQKISHFSEWLKYYLNDVRKNISTKPIFLLGRSASAMLAAFSATQLNKLSQLGLVNGVILISPMLPLVKEHPQWLKQSKRDLYQFAHENNVGTDDDMIDWMYDRHAEFSFDDDILDHMPILNLVGEHDILQVPMVERKTYEALSLRKEKFHYFEIKNGLHDLMTSDRKQYQSRKESVLKIYEFIRKNSY